MRWYKANPTRFEMEKMLLAKHHPGVKLIIEHGKVRVLKRFRTRKDIYHIEGIFPDKFPYAPLRVFVRKPALRKSPPHRYGGGQLCLHGSRDIGPETTAKVYLDWAVQWLKIYEKWLKGKPWPDTNYG